MALRVLVAGLVVAGAVVAITTLGSSPSVDDVLSAHLLTASELPVGWHATPASATTESLVDNRCFKSFPSGSSSQGHSTRTFAQGGGLPFLSDSLSRVSSPPRLLDAAATTLSHCSSINIREGSTTLHGTVARLALAQVGRHSAAFKLVFSVSGFDVTADVVLFTTARDLGEVVYGDSAAPVTGAVTAFARAALSRADGADPVVAAQSITSVPVRLAHTSDGVVGYREFGSGPALILITGYSGTMEGWDPRLVDELAQHHRVVTLDNAGVGDTAVPPGKLTIDAMADQTSALIDALGLGRSDVLGWSMGGLIAQALAVLHPAQVAHLVLCATFPGNGDVVRPRQSDINDLTNGNTRGAIADLFPADQSAAYTGFVTALAAYPAAPGVPASVLADQRAAIITWWTDADPAGRRTASIAAPTLIADGAQDRLDPVVNDHVLAG